jgi:hypothetical protein
MNMRRNVRRLIRSTVLFAALLIAAIPLLAQTSGSILTGRVVDETSGSLPGVTVTATNSATGFQRVIVTGSDGSYRFAALPIGTYTVTGELSGFATVNVREVTLNVATTRTLDLTLRAAALQEAITVTADVPLVADSPSLGTVISQRELENLPLNGRQFANLASLAPGTSLGVNPDPTKPGQLVVALNGGIGRNVNYTIDGGDNTDDTIGGALQNFNLEAVQEFKIQTQSYKAEFGRSTGGVLSVVTKTGTNELEGTVYGFFRNESLNSKTVRERANNLDKRDYERTQYGISIGGPIIRDLAHFFGTYDTTDRKTFFTVNTGGIFPQFDNQSFANPYDDQLITAKASWSITGNQLLQARYGSQEYKDVYSATATSTPDNIGILNSSYSSMLVGHNTQIGSNMVNELLYQYSKFENAILPATDAPSLVFPSGVTAGQNFNTPQQTFQTKHQLRNDFSFSSTLAGQRHDFKTGFNYINEPTLGGTFSSGLSGRFTYGGNNLDAPITRIEYNTGASQFSTPVDQYSVYFQDDWHVNERLILNVGVRYDLWDGFDLDQRSNPIWQTLSAQTTYNEKYLQDFQGGKGGVLENDRNNIGPRLGFTYDLLGDTRHIVRGGWGIYYDFPYTNATILFPSMAVQSNFGQSYFHNNPNGIRNADGSLWRPGQPLPPNQLTSAGRPLPTEVASPTLATPESRQLSLGYSTEVTSWLGATLDLVRIEYRNIPFRFRANPFIPGTNQRRFSQFGHFRIWSGEGQADYEGVNLGLRARVSNKLQLQGFYTWSEATGNILGGADEFRITAAGHQPDLAGVADQTVNPLDPLCKACFGPLNTDARHRVTFSTVYQAPFAINLAGIFRYRSGLPYTEWAGLDLNGDGFAFDLNPGVSHVNSLRGASFSQFDLRVSRNFDIIQGLGLEVIAEVFNLFDAENPARYRGNRYTGRNAQGQLIDNPAFGTPAAWAGDAGQPEQRLLQLGLRLRY